MPRRSRRSSSSSGSSGNGSSRGLRAGSSRTWTSEGARSSSALTRSTNARTSTNAMLPGAATMTRRIARLANKVDHHRRGTGHMRWLELVIALGVILAGAELFTNGVEWVGEGFGLSEGAVGSVLAAIGTALPETILPLVAILSGHEGVGDDVGIGAILGSPLMLATLAVAILGLTILVSPR